MRLVLASASPRRADLLRAAGYAFDVRPATVDESPIEGESAGDYVRRLAVAKASAIQENDAVVLGADTVVVLGRELLGKPADEAEAAAMLRRLSGRTHEVLTGVALRHGNRILAETDRTLVAFATLSPDEIAWYVASGEPLDKAGAYGIQGLASRFIVRIEGSYGTVVGLPVHLVHRLLLVLSHH